MTQQQLAYKEWEQRRHETMRLMRLADQNPARYRRRSKASPWRLYFAANNYLLSRRGMTEGDIEYSFKTLEQEGRLFFVEAHLVPGKVKTGKKLPPVGPQWKEIGIPNWWWPLLEEATST
jgi:hypothetical protein